jgi:hypothetical protein
MSLHQLAKHIQAEGRGEDTQLIHMTPSEIKGLQALAMRHGGSLTINPKTGLPEAGFLSRILPSVVGGAVGVMTMNPMAGAAVGGAMGMAMNKGSLKSGIMSGIGAYGMGSLGAGLAGAGEAALGAEAGLGALPGATAAGTEALAGAGFNSGANLAPETISELVSQGKMTIPEANAYGEAFSKGFDPARQAISEASPWDTMKRGFEATKFDTNYLKQNMLPIGAAGLGIMGAMDAGQQSGMPTAPTQGTSYIRPYTYSQTRNPNWGQPGQPYFNQSYTAQAPVDATQWGSTSFAEGGLASLADGGTMSNQPANVDFMHGDMYPTSQQHRSYYATPTQMPTSAQQTAASYEPKTNPLTGEATVNMADGGVAQDVADYNARITAQAQKEYPQDIAQQARNEYVLGQSTSNPTYTNPTTVPVAQPALALPSVFNTPEQTGTSSIDLNTLLSKYQAANPNARTYNPTTQTYGAASPTQAQLDAFGKQYYDEQQAALIPAYDPYNQGGGKAGGLMPGALQYAEGGISSLGSYSDGGQLLKGPGDGVSDHIPAQIGKHQPARLADGEFVVPARIVSELGNGSTDAGAKRLYAMMDRVQGKRKKSMGKGKFAVDSKAAKDLPA